MQGFSSSFLLLFHQIALGGLFALAATPFHELDRVFYKSTGGVLFIIAIVGFWGKIRIYMESMTNRFSFVAAGEITLQVLFVIFFACYMISLWGEKQSFRARSFSACLFTGLAGLVISAQGFYRAPISSLEALIYPLSFLFSSLLLGSVTVGMLIGHWYLIDTGQSLDPFLRIYKFFVITLVTQTGFLLFAAGLLWFLGSSATRGLIQDLWLDHSALWLTRILIGQAAPLILSWMIWRTLMIPHTMAATGLFYIALLGVFVGEILGKQILALAFLPF